MLVERAGDHLVGRLHDQLHGVGGQLAEVAIGEGGRLLEDPEGSLHGPAPLKAVDADLEIVAGPLCLGAPVAIGGHLHLAHAVGLGAKLLCGLC